MSAHVIGCSNCDEQTWAGRPCLHCEWDADAADIEGGGQVALPFIGPIGPSPKGEQILTFIASFFRANRYSPSLREITTGCDLSTTSLTARHLRALRDAGLVDFQAGIARSVILTGGSDG
jgi:hypothetical protein